MRMPEYKFINYIFVVTGMSYIIDSSGTSKVVKAHEDIFREKGIGYVVAFPISRSRGEGAEWHCKTTGCYGLAIDGQFAGVWTAGEVLNILLKLEQQGKNCIGVLLHHLIRNDIKDVEWMVDKIRNVPVIFYLHDFYTCCVNPNLMKNDKESCIERDIPCDGCGYLAKKEEHIACIRKFIEHFGDRITFVAPAEYTKDHWLQFYPEYKDKAIVISHQKSIGVYTGNKEKTEDNAPLLLGFVGAQKQIKGWDIFKKAVAEVQKHHCNYELYYFGNGEEQLPGVKNVTVDIATQGKNAMIKALQEKRISAVFLVCVCGETYSYTTYESHAANCFIFAMKTGGNIPYTVEKNHWGHVYSNEKELIDALLDEKALRKEINDWKEHAEPAPAQYVDNDEIVNLFAEKNHANIEWKCKRSNLSKVIKRKALNAIFVATRLKS